MSNFELIATIISIIFTLLTTIFGILAKKNVKAKIYYRSLIKVEEKLKELCIVGEEKYQKGNQKKRYVQAVIREFLLEQNIKINYEIIEKTIED